PRSAPHIRRFLSAAIAARSEQRPIFPEEQRTESVRSIKNWKTSISALAQQHQAAIRIDAVKMIGASSGVAGDAANGGCKIFIGAAVVIWRSVIRQVVVVHHVEKINITIIQKIRMQRKTHQTVVMPASHFRAEVDEGLTLFDAVLNRPDASGTFPDKHLSIRTERKPNGLVPRSANRFFNKCARVGGGPQF